MLLVDNFFISLPDFMEKLKIPEIHDASMFIAGELVDEMDEEKQILDGLPLPNEAFENQIDDMGFFDDDDIVEENWN
ncbi:hypothetical protein B9Z55_021823 [Caenorhabditis nigoni]|uniref:Uncharacterized protein n=1 Tax=Caenorhabditis nigoni TaxID=1611254 RepID=A0A2G5TTR9_9PELO|nr:hypothetical protein B9Z55_021823 [Caenorhabditis nigoni]